MTSPAAPAPGASADAIRFHYDIGDEFFRLWLDESMTYSCALFQPGETGKDLERAQLRKLDYLLDQAEAKNAGRVLDIGCGWGSLLERAVTKYGVGHATGLSISDAHAAHTRQRAIPGTEIRVESYLQHEPPAPYDAVFCVEVMEHFAKPEIRGDERIAVYRDFFARCQRWLRPGGILSLQVCAYGSLASGTVAGFIFSDIYRESDMPRLSELTAACDGLFEVTAIVNDRMHYELTLGTWLSLLVRNKARALELVGEHNVKKYMRYLQHSRFAFATGALVLYRMTFRRSDGPAPST